VQTDREGIALDSTDVWTKGPIQRYEERPAEPENLCLADFLAWYMPMNVKRRRGPEEDSDSEDDEQETNINTKYRRRDVPRVLRTRSYDLSDIINYKRELVLLYIPFRNEVVEVTDCNRFMKIFDAQEIWILAKRKQYEKNISLQLLQELRDLKDHEEEDDDARMMEQDDELRRGAVVPTECDADIYLLFLRSEAYLSFVNVRVSCQSRHSVR